MAAVETRTALAEYFVRTYSMPGKTAASRKRNVTLRNMKLDSKKLGSGDAFYVTLKKHQAYSGAHKFGPAMRNGRTSKAARFLVSGPSTMYARLTFDGLALAQGELGALIDIKGAEGKDVTDGLMNRIEQKLWADNTTAVLGRLNASALGGSAASRVFTLLNLQDIYNIHVGMVLQFNSAATGVVASVRTDTYEVTKMDPVTAIFYATRVVGAAGDVALSDYVFVDGDSAGDNGDVDQSFPGIPSFIPSTAPTDTFLGVARTGEGAYLSGWRFAFQGSIEETIKYSFSQMDRFVNREGCKYSVCLSLGDWFKLEAELGSRIVRDPSDTQKFGTDGISVRTPEGLVSCIGIPALRDGRAYIIDWNAWTFHHLKGLPHIITDDGQVFRALQPTDTADTLNGDGIEIRWRAWVHPMCDSMVSQATFPTA